MQVTYSQNASRSHPAILGDTEDTAEVIHVNTLTRRAVYALILNKDPFDCQGDCTVS